MQLSNRGLMRNLISVTAEQERGRKSSFLLVLHFAHTIIHVGKSLKHLKNIHKHIHINDNKVTERHSTGVSSQLLLFKGVTDTRSNSSNSWLFQATYRTSSELGFGLIEYSFNTRYLLIWQVFLILPFLKLQ